jgi:antitoxin (DNA-binding transcriptional repressor) of toxin-antitoxin stability system
MSHTVIHISETEAESDFGSVLARVRAGAEVIIESKSGGPPVAVVRPVGSGPGRLLSESIALAEKHAKELGYEPKMDPEFAADLEQIIDNRKPREPSEWD